MDSSFVWKCYKVSRRWVIQRWYSESNQWSGYERIYKKQTGNKLKQIETNIQQQINRSFIQTPKIPELNLPWWNLTTPVDNLEYWCSGKEIPETQFLYLVHAIAAWIQKSILQRYIRQNGLYDKNKDIDILQHPNNFADKPVISASLISHNKRATRENSGVIIDAPSATIINAWLNDLGTHFDWSGNANIKNNPVNPDILINQSSPISYNEVVVSNQWLLKASIQWYFIKTDSRWYPLDREYWQLKDHLAKKYRKMKNQKDLNPLFDTSQSQRIYKQAKKSQKPCVLIPVQDWIRENHTYPKIWQELWLPQWSY